MPAEPDFDPSDVADRESLLAMFRRIPLGMLEATAYRLLNASRTVRTSKAMKPGPDGVPVPDTVQEPDFAVQLKAWQTIIEQRVGAPSTRKPIEPPAVQQDDNAGSLRPVPKKGKSPVNRQ
jgi:hypothetical protein